jgi:hypothetical protein
MDKKDWLTLAVVLLILAAIFLINGLERGEFVACQADARTCPDGTIVGRTGPDCEFICPTPFMNCIKQGGVVLESAPRQCMFRDGTKVTES